MIMRLIRDNRNRRALLHLLYADGTVDLNLNLLQSAPDRKVVRTFFSNFLDAKNLTAKGNDRWDTSPYIEMSEWGGKESDTVAYLDNNSNLVVLDAFCISSLWADKPLPDLRPTSIGFAQYLQALAENGYPNQEKTLRYRVRISTGDPNPMIKGVYRVGLREWRFPIKYNENGKPTLPSWVVDARISDAVEVPIYLSDELLKAVIEEQGG